MDSGNPLLRVTDGEVGKVASRPFDLREFVIEVAETWPNLLLAAGLVAVFAWQVWASWGRGIPGVHLDGALSMDAIHEGRWWTLFTSMALHGGLAHVVMNALFCLTVGSVIVLRLGSDLSGVLRFYGLFLICGLAGDALFLALHQNGGLPMVGASGALCGFWGALTRLSKEPGQFEPILSKTMGGHLLAFGKMHLWLVGLPLLLGAIVGRLWIPVAWEAHVGGFVAGALLMPLLPQRRGRARTELIYAA